MLEDEVIEALARLAGWECCHVSLYDEEGVEGWRWTSPKGTERTIIGAWDESPAVDGDLLKTVINELTYSHLM